MGAQRLTAGGLHALGDVGDQALVVHLQLVGLRYLGQRRAAHVAQPGALGQLLGQLPAAGDASFGDGDTRTAEEDDVAFAQLFDEFAGDGHGSLALWWVGRDCDDGALLGIQPLLHVWYRT